MGIGGNLMWTALASEIYNKHKKPVLFIGKKGGILKYAIFKNNPYITFDSNSDHIKIKLKFRCLPERTSKKIWNIKQHTIVSRCKYFKIGSPGLWPLVL